MWKTSEIAHHSGQVPSGPGRRASLPARSDAGEFSLAHVVAFQHTICRPIPGGDGIHQHANFNPSAMSPRESAHAFYHCWPTKMTRSHDVETELTALCKSW